MSQLGTLGKYELKSELGRGSTGTVYLATDTFSREDVALKVLDKRLLADPEHSRFVQGQFLNEASLVGKLEHPHIVSILDASVGDNYGYIAMEYVGGGNLRALTDSQNLAPVEKIIEIGFKCCGALDYAYRQGIIHRDIKPANIMVVKDTDIKVTDFGAALLKYTDRTQILDIGSPSYMSPEQVRSDNLTYQSDMFSLGTVLYHLLAGEKPFVGRDGFELQQNILHEEPAPLSYVRPELPPELDYVLMSALAKNPADRYPTWAEFALELAKIGRLSRFDQSILDSSKFDALRAMPMLKAFSDPEIWELVNCTNWTRLPPRSVIVTEDQPGQSLFFLAQGEVKVTKGGRMLSILRSGEIFGEMSYIKAGATPRHATVETLTEVLIAELGAAEADAGIGNVAQSHLMSALLNTLVDRLEFADRRILRVVS
jgi:serine/threonine protein kinase